MTDRRTRQLFGLLVMLAITIAVLSSRLRGDDTLPASTAPGRDVVGVIILDGAPVSDAVLTLCDAESGVPLIKELRRPPTWEEHREMFEQIWFTQSDANGKFVFENVPIGNYRLIAQRWNDTPEFEYPFQVFDSDLAMLGDCELELIADSDEPMELQFAASLGPNRLVIEGDIDEVSLILVSAEAPEDTILGLFALAGPFTQNMLGYCRGPLTIEGIPDGTVGAMVFILDNLPGVNTYTFVVEGGETVVIDVREEDMLAGWSNARRTPMPGLETEMEVVTAHFDAGEEDVLWSLITADTPVQGTAYEQLFRRSFSERTIEVIPKLGSLRRSITLPSGDESTVGKLLAAMAYYELAQEDR